MAVEAEALAVRELGRREGEERGVGESERVVCLEETSGKRLWEYVTPIYHSDIVSSRLGWTPLTADSAGSMFGLFFRAEPVRSFAQAKESDSALFSRFFHAALDRGVYLAPSAYEAGFLSSAHGEAEIAHTLEAAREAFREAAAG